MAEIGTNRQAGSSRLFRPYAASQRATSGTLVRLRRVKTVSRRNYLAIPALCHQSDFSEMFRVTSPEDLTG
jgi:hypothetical protein